MLQFEEQCLAIIDVGLELWKSHGWIVQVKLTGSIESDTVEKATGTGCCI